MIPKFMRAVCVAVLVVASLMGEASAASLPYNEHANSELELKKALALARRQHKRVLIVFGANWCEDCRALDVALHSRATASRLAAHYVMVKVDVGHFDKNLDVAGVYGKPIAQGIPSVVVVTPQNEIVYETRAGELADARTMGADGIDVFFGNLASKEAGY